METAIMGLNWSYTGTMENKMETAVIGQIGLRV